MPDEKAVKTVAQAGAPRGLGSKNPKQGMTMLGSEAVVASLEAEGVDLIFGYPGGQALKIYDALYDTCRRTFNQSHRYSCYVGQLQQLQQLRCWPCSYLPEWQRRQFLKQQ